jgi:hypothetical protein
MTTATYYDHAKNMSNAAVGQAVAAAKRDAVACGDAFRVEANWPGKERFFWIGCEHDVKRLASELRYSRAENVTVSRV